MTFQVQTPDFEQRFMALDKDQSGYLDHQEMEELAVWIYTSTTKDVQQDSQEKVQHVVLLHK